MGENIVVWKGRKGIGITGTQYVILPGQHDPDMFVPFFASDELDWRGESLWLEVDDGLPGYDWTTRAAKKRVLAHEQGIIRRQATTDSLTS